MGSKDEEKQRKRVDLSLVPGAANDSYQVYDRLRDWSARGTDAPETLSHAEIKQVCFALSLYLSLDEAKL